ncbi:hypothetical protein NB636_01995 [Oxalobacter aliiformigenes]|uniref:hypothetical protein n=1 Tax=Oxalobacter aliiformigenes TaxID=2946593 RepID=UPI0022AF7831|nr:hypothetical protein [Oxalobacter aliiformigenes]MCZ4065465.1 hypothetical protein [Oxalobacter aliiformigenes]WAV99659.1 hypothetical protein NB636_01995 [Oxalobacter aliiformigenes]
MEENQETVTENPEQTPIPGQDQPSDTQSDDNPAPEPSQEEEKSELDRMLDDLSEPDPNKEENTGTDPGAEDDRQPEDKAAAKTDEKTDVPENYDDLEQALLSETKTERSRNRIKKLVSEHKELEKRHQEMSAEYQTIASAIAQTGMDERGIAEVLNFCGLAASNDANKMRVALEILDKTRADLLKRLNPVDKYDDIKKAVEDFELPEQYAAELARHRQQQAERQAQLQQRQQSEQYVARVQNAVRQTDHMIAQRRNDPDFRYKYGIIQQKMQDQAFVNTMAQKFQPEQWPDQIMFMYDAISAPKRQQSPLRSTNTSLGKQQLTGDPSRDIMNIFDRMGI